MSARGRAGLALLASAVVCLAGCADLLGVEPLSGSDAASPDASSAPDAGGAAVAPDAGCEITWVDASGGVVPAGAVPNPVPGSTADLYVCRVSSATLGLIPGKLLPGYACYYGDGTVELLAQDYQVLVPHQCTLAWLGAATGVDPPHPVECGEDLDGGVLYSCRVRNGGSESGGARARPGGAPTTPAPTHSAGNLSARRRTTS